MRRSGVQIPEAAPHKIAFLRVCRRPFATARSTDPLPTLSTHSRTSDAAPARLWCASCDPPVSVPHLDSSGNTLRHLGRPDQVSTKSRRVLAFLATGFHRLAHFCVPTKSTAVDFRYMSMEVPTMPLPIKPLGSLPHAQRTDRAPVLSLVSKGERPRRAYRPPAQRSIRLRARDSAGIRLLCALGAVRSDDMARWLAHASGRTSVGARSANETLARWAQAGLADGRSDLRSSRRVWTPTTEGARFADWTSPLHAPDLPSQRQTLTVAAVAIHYIAAGWVWLSWREALGDPQLAGGELAQGVVRSDATAAAVCVAPESASASTILSRLSSTQTDGRATHLWVSDESFQLLTTRYSHDLTALQAAGLRLRSLQDLLR